MAVKIDLELDAKDVQAKIAAIATELETLEGLDGDLDLNFDGIDDMAGQLDELSEALANVDLKLGKLDTDLDDITGRLEELDDVEVGLSPTGSTGDGDSTGNDPPKENFFIDSGFEKAARRISPDGGDADEIPDGRDAADYLNIQKLRKDIGQAYGLDPRKLTHQGTRDDADMRDLPWNELQQKASNLGVYEGNPDRRELAQRIAKEQDFKGQEFTYRSDKLGTISLEDAIRNKQKDTDIDAPEMGGGIDRGSGINSVQDIIDDNQVLSRLDKIEKRRDIFDAWGDGLDGMGRKLRRLKPSMRMVYSIIAAMIPIAIALGTQLLGVAAAMGAVGAAGAGIIGLGLLGHADSLNGSLAQAKQQIRGLKMELFEAFQPTMQQFAPIQSRAFDAIPEALDPIAEEMEGLTKFEDTLFNLGGALAGGMERAVEIINENEQAISHLTTEFSGLIGTGLLDFFEWLIQTAAKNEQLIKDLGGSIIHLITIFYNVSMAIGRVIASIRPLLNFLADFSGLLNNKLVVGVLTFIAVAGGLIFILSKIILTGWSAYVAIEALASALLFLGNGSLISGIISGFQRFAGWVAVVITELTVMETLLLSIFALLSAITLGGILVAGLGAAGSAMESMSPDPPDTPPSGGGFGGPGPGGRGGGSPVYNDNRSYTFQGDFGDYATEKGVNDMIKDSKREEKATELPDVPTDL